MHCHRLDFADNLAISCAQKSGAKCSSISIVACTSRRSGSQKTWRVEQQRSRRSFSRFMCLRAPFSSPRWPSFNHSSRSVSRSLLPAVVALAVLLAVLAAVVAVAAEIPQMPLPRVAAAVEAMPNDLGADGWQFLQRLPPAPSIPSNSARLRKRFNLLRHATDTANAAIDSLNSLMSPSSPVYSPGLSAPATSPPFSQPEVLNGRALTSRQQSDVHAVIFSKALAHCRRIGRSPAVQSGLDLRNFLSDLSSDYFSSSLPEPLDPQRVSLPQSAGNVELLKALPPELAAVYSQPSAILLPQPAESPRPFVFVARGQYPALLKLLLQRKMICFIRSPKAINGLFGVAKPDGKQRLVVDGRPMSACFRRPQSFDIATADRIATLFLPLDSPIDDDTSASFVHARRDQDNFFWQFRVPDYLVEYSALPGIDVARLGLSPAELAAFGVPEDLQSGLVYPALLVLAMGFEHSPLLAQSAHEKLIYQNTSLRREDALSKFSDRALDRVRHTIVMDDLWVAAPVQFRDAVERIEREYDAASARHGFIIKHAKSLHCTTEASESLGLLVDPRTATVSLAPDKFRKLAMQTVAVLLRGKATGRQMLRLTSSWAWPMLINRPALSAFRAVYRFAACARDRTFALWPSVASELRCALGLAPLLTSNLRARFFQRAIATDASLDGCGVSACHVSPSAAADLAFFATSQHAAMREEMRAAASIVSVKPRMPQLRPSQLHQIASSPIQQFVLTSRWSTIVSSPWLRAEPILALEGRAALTGMRWNFSSPFAPSSRFVLFTDSQALFFALSKGRSSAQLLSQRLRSMAFLLLAFGGRLSTAWIPSAANPADEPSRRF